MPGVGGSTGRIRSGASPANTVGSPLSSSTRRNDENSVCAWSGTTSSIAVMTRESLICRDSVGTGPGRSALARNQVTSSIATTLTKAPRPASTTRTGRQVSRSRTSEPSQASVAWPTVAASRTIEMASTDWVIPASRPDTRAGATSRPPTPPRMKPANARTPTTKPCR